MTTSPSWSRADDYRARAGRNSRRTGGAHHIGDAPPPRRQGPTPATAALRRRDLELVRRAETRPRRRNFRAFGGKTDPGAALMARTRIRPRRFYAMPGKAPGPYRPRDRCRARSCPTTTSTTPTRPMKCVGEFDARADRGPASSSRHANPCRASGRRRRSPQRPIARRSPATPLPPMAAIVALKPHAGCACRAGHHRNFYRG